MSRHVEEADVQAHPSRDDAPTSSGEPDHEHRNVSGGWLRAAVLGATHIIVLIGAAGSLPSHRDGLRSRPRGFPE